MKRISKLFQLKLAIISMASIFGCDPNHDKANDSNLTNTNELPTKYLYVASGACYSGGGNTTFSNTTSSNLVYRINLSTGIKDITIADYNSSPSQAGDSPIAIANIDAHNVQILVENTTTAGARRIEKVEKVQTGNRVLFSNNITALSTQLRAMNLMSNGDLLISKGTAIERISSSNVRILKGTSPYVAAPASPCATSTTLISKVSTLANGFILFLHAAASQNRFGFVKAAGYRTAGDCTLAQPAPNVNAYPVASAYDAAHSVLLVAYAGNATTADLNSIYAYEIDETDTSVTIKSTHKIYDSADYPTLYGHLLYGISAMALDPDTNNLYLATATTTATTVLNYTIEKFSYDYSKLSVDDSHVLTRIGATPFYNYGIDTKCIADLHIGN